MFDNQPAESFHLPNYNALTDPVMGEYFDRGGRRRQGLADVTRHFIDTQFEPSFVELHLTRHPMTWREISARPVARHVVDTHLNPPALSEMASYDVASNIYQVDCLPRHQHEV
jgi:hypothetical protein